MNIHPIKPHLLVIGGTGFIGYHLALTSKKKGWKVTVVSINKPKKHRHIRGVNYLRIDISNLKELKKKGLIKIKNFKKNRNRFNPLSKANYLYILTPKGIAHKTKLTLRFMKIKMQEYDELKKDLENEKK